jgi:LysM repeat protein
MKKVVFSLLICLAMLAMALPAYANTVYVVQPGETLSQIAIRFGVSVQAIVAANGLANPNLIRVGQSLIIPAPGTTPAAPAAGSASPAASTAGKTYQVQAGDTLYKISRQHGVSLTALMAANHLTSYTIFNGQVLVIPSAGGTGAAAASTPAAPAAPAGGGYTAGPLHADFFFVETSRIAVGMEIWFDWKVTNVSGGDGRFGILSMFSDINLHGESWTNSGVQWPGSMIWRDHLHISSPGTYPFYLAVCFEDKDSCQNNGALWQRLSDTVWVTVENATGYTGYNARGVVGNYFYVENAVTRKGTPVWYNFRVTNTTGDDIYYGVLSARAKGGPLGMSWTSNRIRGGETIEWRDHFYDLPAGTYAVSLGICYAGKDACGDERLWERLSDDVVVTVKDLE